MKKIFKLFLNKIKLYHWIKERIKKNKVIKFQKNSNMVFEILIAVLEKNKIEYWLEYGTLLGVIREKGIIKHDYDIDIGILETNVNKKELENILKINGFKKVKEILADNKITEQKYIFKNFEVDIDFYFFYKEKEVIKGYAYEWLTFEEKYLAYMCTFSNFQIKYYEIKEKKVRVPKNFNKHLLEYYGEDYLIPNKNWEQKDAKNIKIINVKVDEIKYI
ncbi:MAG: LicD family protein [Fusobacterium varium]|uniref:LicD family protein n=1 Tax=Fusobacterium varium TaxID=856 RepID=UPI00243319E2|nr:LicD family protein [Fusobacterium varium]UYI80109.1 MAG: LicD family protein [Fusobacterium varium]